MAKSKKKTIDTPTPTPDITPEPPATEDATAAPRLPLMARASTAVRALVSKYLRTSAAKLTAAATSLTTLATRVEGEATDEPAAEAEPVAA